MALGRQDTSYLSAGQMSDTAPARVSAGADDLADRPTRFVIVGSAIGMRSRSINFAPAISGNGFASAHC